MTSGYNHSAQQKTAVSLPSVTEISETELAPAQKSAEESEPLYCLPVVLKIVNEPAFWDEAWFANYE